MNNGPIWFIVPASFRIYDCFALVNINKQRHISVFHTEIVGL